MDWGWRGLRDADPTITPYSAVRDGDWKLIFDYDTRAFARYNLKDDLGETTNLVAEHPDEAHTLATRLQQWLVAVEAQTLRDRQTGEPVPLPPSNGTF